LKGFDAWLVWKYSKLYKVKGNDLGRERRLETWLLMCAPGIIGKVPKKMLLGIFCPPSKAFYIVLKLNLDEEESWELVSFHPEHLVVLCLVLCLLISKTITVLHSL
jgi:hypothetical protein